MRVWLVNPFEATPVEGAQRTFRMGHVNRILRQRGHDVFWWSATFFHASKEQRFEESTTYEADDGTTYRFLYCRPYKRNISRSRLASHEDVADNFTREAPDHPAPDVILSSYPSLALSEAVTEYAMPRGIPTVLDIRDLWPDAWLDLAPRPLRPLAKLLLSNFAARSAKTCQAATAIFGINEEFVDWGVDCAGRERAALDQAFPFGYDPSPPPEEALKEARQGWDARGVPEDDGAFNLCFFGFFSRHFNFGTVIDAAKRLAGEDSPARFVLCGSGDALEEVRAQAEGLPNVVLPGWVGQADIWSLMERSSMGLAPYRPSATFLASLPNKSIEYLAAGLPVMTSLDGALQRLVLDDGCGCHYDSAAGLADHIASLIGDRAALRRMSERAEAIFKQRFRAGDVYGRLVDSLEELHTGTS